MDLILIYLMPPRSSSFQEFALGAGVFKHKNRSGQEIFLLERFALQAGVARSLFPINGPLVL